MSDSHSPLTLGAIFYEGFELLDVYGPLEMFGSVGPELRIVTVAAGGDEPKPIVVATGQEGRSSTDVGGDLQLVL